MSSSVSNVSEFLAAVMPALEKNFPYKFNYTFVDSVNEQGDEIKFYNPSGAVFIKESLFEFYGDREVILKHKNNHYLDICIKDTCSSPHQFEKLNWEAEFRVTLETSFADKKFKLVEVNTLNCRHTKAGVRVYDAPYEKRQYYQGQFAGTVDALIELLNKEELATQPYYVCKA
jgi:hypothetical protein